MSFPDKIIEQAWERANGRCECERKTCGHTYKCNRQLSRNARGDDDSPYGWEAHHKTAVENGGDNSLSNCEILCIKCHKNTRSYGKH